ncbi:hypothetical protein D9M72_434520 [compost metagenome]
MRLGNGERADRLDEEEVIGQNRKQSRRDRRDVAGIGRRGQDGEQIEKRDVGQDDEALDQQADRRGHAHRAGGNANGAPGAGRQRLFRGGPPLGRHRLAIGDKVDADPGHALGQGVGKRLTQKAHRKGLAARTDDDLRRMFATRKLQDLLDEVVADDAARLGAKLFGKTKGLVEPAHILTIAALTVGALNEDDNPGSVQSLCQPACGADHLLGKRIGTDADEQALAARPNAFDRILLEVVDHLVVDPVGRAPERQFAQCRQVAEAKEAIDSTLGAVGQVYLALLQPLDQFGRREIDEQHLVGPLQYRIRHPLAHRHASDLRNDIGKTFQVLDVERCPDIDAGGDQFLDVLIALRMPAFSRVAVSELVNDDDLGTSGKGRIQVELGQHAAAMGHIAAWQDF